MVGTKIVPFGGFLARFLLNCLNEFVPGSEPARFLAGRAAILGWSGGGSHDSVWGPNALIMAHNEIRYFFVVLTTLLPKLGPFCISRRIPLFVTKNELLLTVYPGKF